MALDRMRRVGTGHRHRIPGTRAEISLFEVPDPQNRPEQHLAAARAQLGKDRLLGVSCYDRLELALAAREAGADYVAFGSAFPSATKPRATRAPLSLYREAKARLGSPVVAIGGITTENAQSVIEAGVDAVAVISALFDAPDIEAAARSFSRLFHRKAP